MSGHSGATKEGGIFIVDELTEASKPVWEFLAGLITAFINIIIRSEDHH